MKFLVHTCCADCALHLIEALPGKIRGSESPTAFYFYNPNIQPQEEYYARLRALKLVFSDKKKYRLIIPHWSPKEYFAEIKKLMAAHIDVGPAWPAGRDRTVRCARCWKLRLTKTCSYAKENGYDTVTTTMLTSNYLNTEAIIRIGSAISMEYKIKFYVPKYKREDLHNTGFYKQNYCGCVFSLMERMAEKYQLN
jgi:hypothetical protein